MREPIDRTDVDEVDVRPAAFDAARTVHRVASVAPLAAVQRNSPRNTNE